MQLARLATEAAVVGMALAAALAAVTVFVKITNARTAVMVGLVAGAALHLLFELTGLNGAYCSTGHACTA